MDEITITPAPDADVNITPDATTDAIIEDIKLPSEASTEVVPTQEELLAAYKELKASKEKPATTTEIITETSTDALKDINERISNGTLDDAFYTDMEAKGYSKSFIDTYAEGVKTQKVEAFKETIKDYGSLDDYASALVYAQNNWSADQIKSYNDALNNSNMDTVKILAGSLIKEAKANSKAPENAPITQVRKAEPTVHTGYETLSDMRKDMSDRRYQTDPTYRAKVVAKIDATTAFNF